MACLTQLRHAGVKKALRSNWCCVISVFIKRCILTQMNGKVGKQIKMFMLVTSMWPVVLTCLVRVAQYGFLLDSKARTRPVFHPGCYGKLVGQVLRHHVIWNICSLSPIKSVDEVAVSSTVSEQRRCPVRGRAGSREEVGAARRRTWTSL